MRKTVAALAALAAIGWLARSQAPELQRYVKVRRM